MQVSEDTNSAIQSQRLSFDSPIDGIGPVRSRTRIFCFGMFLACLLIVLFFLTFNYSIPYLKDRVDHEILDRLSLIGARVYPLAVLLMGVAYVGIIIAGRRSTARQNEN